MTCRIAQLQYKELVDISDGTRYGCIGDLEIDPDTGTILNIVIYGKGRILGLLGREKDLILPWRAIKRIGEDLILVDGAAAARGKDRPD